MDEPSALRAQIALVDEARRAVAVADSGHAEELLARYARTYPAGALAEDMAVLGVENATRSGQSALAKRRATAFLAAFPLSSHAARMRVLKDQP